MRSADRVTAVLLLAIAVAFSAGALKYYSWWGSGGPGSAFLPFWLGLVMAVLAVMMFFSKTKIESDWLPRGTGLRNMLVVLGATILFVAALKVVGMILGTALYLVALIRYLGRRAEELPVVGLGRPGPRLPAVLAGPRHGAPRFGDAFKKY